GQDSLARFLPAWQGVGADAGGPDRTFEVIAQLQGVPIPASVLERDMLPARVRDYTPRYLDELLAAGEVMWVGAGPLGRDDGKVALHLRGSVLSRVAPVGDPPEGEEHDRIREVLAARGACFFRELGGATDAATLEALWDLVWAGEVTNDTFAAVRATQGAKRRSGSAAKRGAGGRPRVGNLAVLGPPRGQGRWSLVERGGVSPTQAAAAQAGALLERHGVLTREAARGEGVAGGFAGVYPVLRAMEESGRVRRGYFVSGLGGAQFALPGAVDRLRSSRGAAGTGEPPAAIVLATTDPANAYGVALPWPVTGPRRVAGAYVVLLDGLATLYVEKGGKALVALRPYDGGWEAQAVAAVTTLLTDGRLSRLNVERSDPELAPHLAAAGFVPTPKGLVRYA
ncbi:MAG: Lhr family helicase, partial [Acidimicrobiales bacterium]